MSSPLSRYDPTDFTGLPTAKGENPHINRHTQPEDVAVTLPIIRDGYTDARFPLPFVPTYKLIGNVQESQRDALKASPNAVLAFVIHGGGQRYIMKYGAKKVEAIMEFLLGLALTESSDQAPSIAIHLPEGNSMDSKNRFGQPWTLFVELGPGTESLRAFLLWQGIFAINPTLSFAVYNLDDDEQPWTIMTLTGVTGAVVNTDEAKRQVLATIKADLWRDRDFCFYVATQAKISWKITGDIASRVKEVTDTLDIEFIDVDDPNTGGTTPAYLIYAKPLSKDRDVYLKWVAFFKGPPAAPKFYRRGIFRLNVSKAADCRLCKASTHCARDCLLPAVPGWQGPTLNDLQLDDRAEHPGDRSEDAPSAQTQEIWRRAPKRGKEGRGGARGGGRGGSAARGKKPVPRGSGRR